MARGGLSCADTRDVRVFINRTHEAKQEDDFVLCPLGVQFYAAKPIEEYTVMEFTLKKSATRAGKPITCQGVVVRCEFKEKVAKYRVWLKFLDMPEKTRELIRCTAKEGNHICSYCANF